MDQTASVIDVQFVPFKIREKRTHLSFTGSIYHELADLSRDKTENIRKDPWFAVSRFWIMASGMTHCMRIAVVFSVQFVV
jgi:hypothetical protein